MAKVKLKTLKSYRAPGVDVVKGRTVEVDEVTAEKLVKSGHFSRVRETTVAAKTIEAPQKGEPAKEPEKPAESANSEDADAAENRELAAEAEAEAARKKAADHRKTAEFEAKKKAEAAPAPTDLKAEAEVKAAKAAARAPNSG